LGDKSDEVRYALNTLIYVAKERQEKMADESKRNLPLIVRWNSIEDKIAITVSCAANQPKDEENRLKQLREKKVKGASASLKIGVNETETDLTYSIFKEIAPITIRYSPLTNNNPTQVLAPIVEAITATDPADAKQTIPAMLKIINSLGISALPANELEKLESAITEHIAKFNPNIRNLADVLKYSGWDASYKAELLSTLFGPIPDIEVRFEKEPDKINLIFTIAKPISAEVENSIAKIVASIKATAAKTTNQKTGAVSLTVTINQG
jgi:hypothetical protein